MQKCFGNRHSLSTTKNSGTMTCFSLSNSYLKCLIFLYFLQLKNILHFVSDITTHLCSLFCQWGYQTSGAVCRLYEKQLNAFVHRLDSTFSNLRYTRCKNKVQDNVYSAGWTAVAVSVISTLCLFKDVTYKGEL